MSDGRDTADDGAERDRSDDPLLAQLLDEIRAAVPADPVPRSLVDASRALITWASFDDELTALLHEAAEAVGVRSGATETETPLLTFELPDASSVVEVEPGAGALTVRVLPAAGQLVVVTNRDGELASASVDALGACAFTNLPNGPTRLEIRGTTRFSTEWFVL